MGASLGARRQIAHHDAIQPAEKKLVEDVDQAAFAVQIETQLVRLEAKRSYVLGTAQFKTNSPGGITGLDRRA